MAKRVKEEDKIERTIRGLLKLPGNRRCINCNSLGPQYVCTTFLTFVCTNCSGVHREFTHRVKSVSMAKFTAEEVTALQTAGNERARQIYLKAWDPQRHVLPDCSNLQKLRDFIKHVYVDRRYAGEKNVNELPRLRLNDKDSSQERRKTTPYHGGLQNLQGEISGSRARKDNRSSIYYYDERSSPRYSKENSRFGGYGKHLACIEIVDNRIRDDRHGNRKLSSEELKSSSQLSDSQENLEKSSPAVACGVGEDVKANKARDAGSSDQDQNLVRVDPGETKRENLESLIDFSISSELSDAAATPQTQQMPSSNGNSNWNSLDLSAKNEAPGAPIANTLEALLFELSVPSTEADSNLNDGTRKGADPSTLLGSTLTGAVAPDFITGDTAPLNSLEASVSGSTEIAPFQPSDGDKSSKGLQFTSMPQKHMGYDPSANTGLDSQLMTAAVVPNFEQGADSKSDLGTTAGVGSQLPSSEVNSCGRQELPADLFAMHYPPFPRTNPGWQSGTPHVMSYNSQYYPNSVTTMDYANSARPTNPFDLDDGESQSGFTGMPASIHASSYQAQHSGTYMGQQVYGNAPSLRPEGVGGNYGSNPDAFSSFNTTTQPSGGYAAPNVGPVSSSHGIGNNPFE